MNYSDIKQVFYSTSSLTLVSYMDEQKKEFLDSEVTLSNFPFAKSDKDNIEISVFSFAGDLITSSYFVPTGTHLPFTKSYYDVFNNFVQYSYSSYQSDLPIVGETTKSVFLDVGKNLSDMGIEDGNYKVGIQLIRDVVGSYSDLKQRLIIDNISPSRTEITVIPSTIRSVQSDINSEFYAYSQNKVILRDIADKLISGISSPEIYKIYYDVAAQSTENANSFLYNYAFNGEAGVTNGNIQAINFLTDIYYGVKIGNRRSSGEISSTNILGIYDQFSNWIYQNYNNYFTFQEVKDQYYSLFLFIVNQELNRLIKKSDGEYAKTVSFLTDIYYGSIFFPVESAVETEYSNYISGYFKNFLNFGDGKSLAILNTKVIPSSDPTQHDRLALKLEGSIPTEVQRGSSTWIENTFASAPILQNVYFFLSPSVQLVTLRGPNLLHRIESQGNTTDTLSIESLISETGSLYTELMSRLNSKIDSKSARMVDYRYFENFINFSSAQLRLDAYGFKMDSISELTTEISDLDSKLMLQPDDVFYNKEKADANSLIDGIKSSYDGYESFLHQNPQWYIEHNNTYNGITSASIYDGDNQGSLMNSVPSFMLEDSENDDYTKFVGMIGHYFDNLSLFISQFTQKNNTDSSPNRGISMDLAYDALLSLGWEPEISRENLPLLLGSFSKFDFSPDSPLYDKVGIISENDRNKLIWKRILNTLPFIYKTKGTRASINAIISCFGIPKNIIKIKEYGSIDYSNKDIEAGLYIFEENKYEPYFSGSGEYFEVPWTGSINSVEFDLRFNNKKISSEGEVFRLASCEDNWVIGVYRERGKEWGNVFFSIDDGTGSISTTRTQRVPLFDGNSYTILLRRDDVGNPNEYPTEYELLVKKANQGRIVFSASSSLILSGSYNNSFQSGNNLYVGNYHQNTASLGIDVESFWGNIDEIKLWEIAIDNNSLESHTLYKGSYNYSSPSTMVDRLLVRASFNQPIDLYSSNGSSSFSNLAFRKDFPNIIGYNFPLVSDDVLPTSDCLPQSVGSKFPYQFSINNVIQSANVSAYGSQTIRSNKIGFVDQTLISPLSMDSRSTPQSSTETGIDSNKVGVFFSPIDSQNEQIIKFFGGYNFGDLIGDPVLLYAPAYRQFEKFRQIYYEQGFGIVDYQTFMNLVRGYFDKAMFKYIETLVPARTKLVSGILVEPTILERPKIQLKPIAREEIKQDIGTINLKNYVNAVSVGQSTGSIQIGHKGKSILNDVNHTCYLDSPDPYGMGAATSNGVYFYKDDYYRVDIIKAVKSYQTQREYTLPKNQWSDHARLTDNNGEVKTISSSYYELNVIKLPTITEYYFTASSSPAVIGSPWYFSGSISQQLVFFSGAVTTLVSSSHTISGITSGSFAGNRKDDVKIYNGKLNKPMKMSASFFPVSSPALYSGYFNIVSGGYTFEGTIRVAQQTTESLRSKYYTTLYSENTTSSIYQEIKNKADQSVQFPLFLENKEIAVRLKKSLEVVPSNRTILSGYFPTHYKYKKQIFSQKEINAFENSYDQGGKPFSVRIKLKKNSQSKKTTIDPDTGNLNGTEPIERKTT